MSSEAMDAEFSKIFRPGKVMQKMTRGSLVKQNRTIGYGDGVSHKRRFFSFIITKKNFNHPQKYVSGRMPQQILDG